MLNGHHSIAAMFSLEVITFHSLSAEQPKSKPKPLKNVDLSILVSFLPSYIEPKKKQPGSIVQIGARLLFVNIIVDT